MIKSMTGYGKATLSKDLRNYQIEIKSVNHRYLDISIKMRLNSVGGLMDGMLEKKIRD